MGGLLLFLFVPKIANFRTGVLFYEVRKILQLLYSLLVAF